MELTTIPQGDGNNATHAIKEGQEATGDLTKRAAELVAEFIQLILQRSKDKSQEPKVKDTPEASTDLSQDILEQTDVPELTDEPKNHPRLVEIQVGKQKLYKGLEGQEALKNSLSPQQIQTLQQLIQTPSTNMLGTDLESAPQSLGGRVITIRVDNEVVLRLDNGILTNNLQLEAIPELQVTQEASEPELNGAEQIREMQSDFVADPESLDPAQDFIDYLKDPEAQLNQAALAEPETLTPEAKIPEAKISEPEIATEAIADEQPELEIATQAIADQPPKIILEELTSDPQAALVPDATNERKALSFKALLASELVKTFKPTPEVQQWFSEVGQSFKERATQDIGKTLKFSDHLVHNHKTRQVAQTALLLLDSDPKGLNYDSEDYKIEAIDRKTISISDRHGQEVLRFCDSPFGPRIITDNLTPHQVKAFAVARQHLNKHGVELLLTTEPHTRVSYLQGLAPQGDREVIQGIQNNRALHQAHSILDHFRPEPAADGTQTFQGGGLEFSRQGHNLQVSDPEQGVILSHTNGQVKGNLPPEAAKILRTLSTQIEQLQATTQARPLVTSSSSSPKSQIELD